MNKFIAVLSLLIATSTYGAGTPFIDPDYRQLDLKEKEKLEKCEKKARNPIDSFICADEIIGNPSLWAGGIPPRGTRDFCEYKYKPMSFTEKKKVLGLLKKQQPTARRDMEIHDRRLPGEMTQEHFQTELVCVESYMAEDQENKIQSLGRELGIGRR